MAKKNNEFVWYDPSKDLHAVEQYGFVDLTEVFQTGTVTGDLNASLENYNDIEDPASILGKPRDVFEAYAMNDYVKSVGKKDVSES